MQQLTSLKAQAGEIRLAENVLSRQGISPTPVQPTTGGIIRLRPYQYEMVRETAKNLLIVSPTGSGKTLVILAQAALRLQTGMATVILVPKLGIATGFEKFTGSREFICTGPDGQETYRLPLGSVFHPPEGGKVEAVSGLLNNGKCIIVCSSYVFMKAYETGQITAEALARLHVVIDEVHHSGVHAYDRTDEGEGTGLGKMVLRLLRAGVGVHGYTATDYRTDLAPILPHTHRGDFKVIRRTLAQHFAEGYCPNLSASLVLYDRLSAMELDEVYRRDEKLVGDVQFLGRVESLIDSYVEHYFSRPPDQRLPTLMVIPQQVFTFGGVRYTESKVAAVAFALQQKIEERATAEGRQVRVMNLGSDDGVTLASKAKDIESRYRRLNDEQIDVVISIRVMDEGVDWPDCAQVFLPRVPHSLQLLIQRIGRMLRKKQAGHPSPDFSWLVLFEIGIIEEDRHKVSIAMARLAVRLAAIFSGLEISPEFRFACDPDLRARIDLEKGQATLLGPNVGLEIAESLIGEATKGATGAEMVQAVQTKFSEAGVELSPIAAVEVAVQLGVVAEISEIHCKRMLLNPVMAKAKVDEGLVELFNELTVIGAERFARILSGMGAEQVADALRSEWEEFLAELRRFVETHGRMPVFSTGRSPDECRLGRWAIAQRMWRNVRGRLSHEQIGKLEGVPGWTWDHDSGRWMIAYSEVRAAHLAGQCPISPAKEYQWMKRQKQAYAAGTLTKDRADLLEQIPGWFWLHKKQNAWDHRCGEVESFVGIHGRLPRSSGGNAGERRLCKWVRRQRKPKVPLSVAQTDRLVKIGVV